MSGNLTPSAFSATFAINGSIFHLMTTFKPYRNGCNTVRLAKGMRLRHVQTRSFLFTQRYTLVTTDIYSFSRGPQDVQNAENQRSPAISDHPSSPKHTVTSTPQRSSASPQTDATHHRFPPLSAPPPGSPAPFHALTPSNYGPAHESRRRNAEQRAANLREDPYIAEVEPNRVFCKLCQKWVQLRQDSSYCAYPWMQHRQKCEARQ